MAIEWLYLCGIWLLMSRHTTAQEGASIVNVKVYNPRRKAPRIVERMQPSGSPHATANGSAGRSVPRGPLRSLVVVGAVDDLVWQLAAPDLFAVQHVVLDPYVPEVGPAALPRVDGLYRSRLGRVGAIGDVRYGLRAEDVATDQGVLGVDSADAAPVVGVGVAVHLVALDERGRLGGMDPGRQIRGARLVADPRAGVVDR